eukprot:TCONS_00011829-protein
MQQSTLGIEKREHQTGSVHHLDVEPVLFHNKKKQKKDQLLQDRSSVHNDDDTLRMIDNELAKAMLPDAEVRICGCKEGTFRIISGLILVVLIAVSWTGFTQFGRSVYDKDFKSPYFTAWFSICFQVSMYPIFMVPLMCQKTPFRIRTFLRQTAEIFGTRGFCLRSVVVFLLRYSIPFTAINLMWNYFYYRSLKELNAGVVATVFASQSTFVYILSLIFLKDKFFILRMSSVLLSLGGIILMGHGEGFDNPHTLGILFAALAALMAAIYQVAFKRVLGQATSGQVALFVTVIGITNLLFFAPFIFLLHYVGLEKIDWHLLPWLELAGTAALQLVFHYLVSFGIAFTFPLFISIGILISVPFNAVVDAIFRNESFGISKTVAFFLIIVGFMLLLIPIRKVERLERKWCCGNGHGTEKEEAASGQMLESDGL